MRHWAVCLLSIVSSQCQAKKSYFVHFKHDETIFQRKYSFPQAHSIKSWQTKNCSVQPIILGSEHFLKLQIPALSSVSELSLVLSRIPEKYFVTTCSDLSFQTHQTLTPPLPPKAGDGIDFL